MKLEKYYLVRIMNAKSKFDSVINIRVSAKIFNIKVIHIYELLKVIITEMNVF